MSTGGDNIHHPALPLLAGPSPYPTGNSLIALKEIYEYGDSAILRVFRAVFRRSVSDLPVGSLSVNSCSADGDA